MAETNSLLNCRTSKGYRGFESLSHRCESGKVPNPFKTNLKVRGVAQVGSASRLGIGRVAGFLPSFQNTDNSSGCSAARLAHLLWEQGVAGSNLATPTTCKRNQGNLVPFLFRMVLSLKNTCVLNKILHSPNIKQTFTEHEKISTFNYRSLFDCAHNTAKHCTVLSSNEGVRCCLLNS